ncbi:MAG: hypothetical protein WHV66_02230 [Anaerolineales bacterium]
MKFKRRAVRRYIKKVLRQHWAIENGVFRVCDVIYDEDRLHGRKIGLGLSSIRNAAITLLRQYRYPYIPDAQRAISAQPSLAFALLGIKILKKALKSGTSEAYCSSIAERNDSKPDRSLYPGWQEQ